MKKLVFFSLTVLMISLQSCLSDKCTETREFIQFDPVYVTADEFRTDEVKTTPAQKLENPGKMSFYNNYLFINEQGRGIHVYDISDDTNPVEVTFYAILGNFDMSIRNNILYADNVIDLIGIDISDIQNPTLVSRVENYHEVNERTRYVAYYTKSDRVTILDCSQTNFNQNRFFDGDFINFAASAETSNVLNAQGDINSVSINGSFSRFTIVDKYLYTVDNRTLNTFDVSSLQPEKINSKNLGWGIETIFPYGSNLFIGSNSGMYVFDNSEGSNPTLASTFDHARACDPVVVSGNYAYVTLRDGNQCQGFVNQLDVIDVSNIFKPELVKSYPMINPHGLSVRDNVLYVCEGVHGLKVLDVTEKDKVKELEFDDTFQTYDVISLSSTRLLMIGADGFYFINTADKKDLKVVSSILIGQ